MNFLTIVTITYNDNDGLSRTYNSIKNLLKEGVQSIIINGGNNINSLDYKYSSILSDKDEGIYDALNKGISKVKSKYFMLLHSGDILLSDEAVISSLINKLEKNNLDLILSNQFIGLYNKFRKHRSDNWKPWMLKFGAQPAHLPTIYKTEFALKFEYDKNIEIIGDYIYFEKIFKTKPRWQSTSHFIVRMEAGGKTSSGIKSFFYVSSDFIKNKGLITGFWLSIARFPFKIIQAI